MTNPTTPTTMGTLPPTDSALDELARQWACGAPIVLSYDGEGRPIDGCEFSMPRFRSAALAAPAPAAAVAAGTDESMFNFSPASFKTLKAESDRLAALTAQQPPAQVAGQEIAT